MTRVSAVSIHVTAAFLLCTPFSAVEAAEQVLFDFDHDFDVTTVTSQDATVAITERDGDTVLRLSTGHDQQWPGITLRAPGGHWDLSRFAHVAVDVANVGTNLCDVHCRIDSPTDKGERISVTGNVSLAPGETKTLVIPLKRQLPQHLAAKLFGMRGYPGDFVKENGIDPANIDQLLIFASQPSEDHALEIDNIRAAGSHHTPAWLTMSADEFFPMIDRFGQFALESWPGKVESIDDFPRFVKQETIDLERHPGPESWNQYGGWKAGPQLEASGRFRVEKHRGQLVVGRSRGSAVLVAWNRLRPIDHRLTHRSPIASFCSPTCLRGIRHSASSMGNLHWAPHGYYQGKSYQTYNFTGANLLIKYGSNWKEQFDDLCHRRLRSWGMNTIGNWSDSSIYLMRKTPYVATLGAGKKPIRRKLRLLGEVP